MTDMFYQAVVASVLLYGNESWVVSPLALQESEGFHVEAARYLTGMRPRSIDGKWVYPHSADIFVTAHLQTIEYYIQKRCHTVHNTIRGRDALKDCKGAERCRNTPPRLFWVAQDITVPERRKYGAERGGGTPPPSASRAPCPCRIRNWKPEGGQRTSMISRMGAGWMPERHTTFHLGFHFLQK